MTAGAERSLLEIAAYIAANGADVLVAVPAAGPLSAALTERGVNSVGLPYDWAARPASGESPEPTFTGFAAILDCVRDFGPDAILTNTSVIPWFAEAAEQLGIPHAWFIREDMSAAYSGISYFPDTPTIVEQIRRQADLVFVPSFYMQRGFRDLLGRDDVRVAYPPVEERLWNYESEPLRPGPPWRVIVCGGIHPRKNQLEMLEAAVLLRGRGCEFHLTLLGPTNSEPYRRELEAFVEDHELVDRVKFLADQANPYPILGGQHISVVPSTVEPSSRVMVESMLLGVATIASDVGGNTEKAGGAARAALLYPSGRPDVLAGHLETLMSDPVAWRDQAERGREFARTRLAGRDQLQVVLDGLAEIAALPKTPWNDWILPALAGLASRVATVDAELERAAAERDALRGANVSLVAEGDALRSENEALRAESVALAAAHDDLGRTIAEQRARMDDLGRLAAAYDRSRSWRLTAPARALGRAVRRLARRT